MVFSFNVYKFLSVYSGVSLTLMLAFLNYPTFDHHTNLPYLCARLYWTYNPENSTLSVNFNAAPPISNGGWVAWGINPNGSGMIGAQAIVLSLDSHCTSLVSKVYNLSSYQAVAETSTDKVWAHVLQLDAAYCLGLMKFAAKIALPEKRETINHVWQIGRSSTTDGKPNVHDMHEANLKSFGVLNLSYAKKSNFWKYVDGMLGALSFEKGCTLGRKSIWNEYITIHNMGAASYYSGMLQVIVLYNGAKKAKKDGVYWKLFHDGVLFSSWVINFIMMIKVIELLVILKLNFLSSVLVAALVYFGHSIVRCFSYA